MEHHVYFDKLVQVPHGEKQWVREILIFQTEKDAFNWSRRYTWSSSVKNIKIYPKHFSNKF